MLWVASSTGLISIFSLLTLASSVEGANNNNGLENGFASSNGEQACNLQKFGKDDEVDNLACVCNLNYCDKLQFRWPLLNDVLVVRTTMAGLRFHKTLLANGKIDIDMADGSNKEQQATIEQQQQQQQQQQRPQKESATNIARIELHVDTSEKYQKIFGFGGALSDSASLNIQSLPDPLNKSLMEDYFNSRTGLEYNFIRIPLGGADFSVRPYSYDDNDDADDNLADDNYNTTITSDSNKGDDDFELKRFKLAYEDVHMKIPLIKVAREEAYPKEVRIIASAWTAPKWMKTNNNYVKGTLKGRPGGPYYKAYADYLLKSYNEYKKRNVTFWGLTIQNEPIHPLNPMVNFSSMILRPEDQRDFIKFDLGPKMEQKKLIGGQDHVELMVLDDNLLLAEHYLKIVLADELVYNYTTGIAIHWYYNYAVPHHILTTIKRRYPDKFILSTEASEGYLPMRGLPVEIGSWRRGVTYALDILKDLKFHVNGWVDWNLALDTRGGPNWAKNFVDSLVIVNATAKEYYKNPGFYVMAQISKFLPRGSRIVSTRLNNQGEYSQLYDDTILTLGALTPSNHLVVIVLNNHMRPRELLISVDKRFKLNVTVPENSITSIVATNWWQ